MWTHPVVHIEPAKKKSPFKLFCITFFYMMLNTLILATMQPLIRSKQNMNIRFAAA